MEELYRSYLSFLRSLGQGLDALTDLAEKKFKAAQTDDLLTLNELLNQEQAQALNFRGLELTRSKLLGQLGLQNVPLAKTPDRFPPAMREEARQAAADLAGRYAAYRRASSKARTLLEQNLREVDAAIAQMGGPPPEAMAGPGYQAETEAAPPPSMKTDFRA